MILTHFYFFSHSSWIITWFSHDVKNINDIARMYDVLLSSHPLLIYYLCAAVSSTIYFALLIRMILIDDR